MLYRLGTSEPWLDEHVYVAPTASVIGNVRLHQRSSVWFGAVLRGDGDVVEVGPGCNIQDNAVLHADPGFPLWLEENVTIGHTAMLHGCQVGMGSLIGIGAVVLNGARVGCNCLVAAKTLVPEGKTIPDHTVVKGIPARTICEIDERRIAMLRAVTASYLARSERYAAQLVQLEDGYHRAVSRDG